MVLEMLNQRVRGVGALESIVGKRVLVSIPHIPTQAELAQRRRWRVWLVVSILALAVLGVVLLHFFYMPFDLLLMKAMSRFG